MIFLLYKIIMIKLKILTVEIDKANPENNRYIYPYKETNSIPIDK